MLLDVTLLQKAFPLPPLGGSRDPRTWVSIDDATRRRYYQVLLYFYLNFDQFLFNSRLIVTFVPNLIILFIRPMSVAAEI